VALVPAKATFAPGEPIEIEVRGLTAARTVSLWRLDEQVAAVEVDPETELVRFPAQPEGGYGVEAAGARTAIDVLADPLSRARYGFVADYARGRPIDGVVDNARRLHLNAVQFYDWMYRHAALLPPGDEFVDALDRALSLDTVRRLAGELRAAGSLPIGYAAVYAAGRDEWPAWEADGLFHANGEPWTLGEDFLRNVDPTSERWLAHFAEDLRESEREVGFAGFHLDQYGAPKVAFRRDGSPVDLASAFPALIDRLARELPESRLIFNNVNDFPTWATARADQAAIYIEVWPPHVTLADLAHLIEKAHGYAPEKSVVLAAYLSVYASTADERAAAAAQSFLHATVLSHGATALLHGEEQAALTEAYYVRHKQLADDSQSLAQAYLDFAVRYGDLLFDRAAVDVTTTQLGGVNEEVRLEAAVPAGPEARAGTLWGRVVQLPGGLLVSLIDLSAQDDLRWDAPKRPPAPLAGVRLGVERRTQSPPRFLFAAPEDQPALRLLDGRWDGRHDWVELPPFRTWALVWLPDDAA
jgi:dextranase